MCEKTEVPPSKILSLRTMRIFTRKSPLMADGAVGRKPRDETFWTVRKSGLTSTIETHCRNPIKNTYESLWINTSDSPQAALTVIVP